MGSVAAKCIEDIRSFIMREKAGRSLKLHIQQYLIRSYLKIEKTFGCSFTHKGNKYEALVRTMQGVRVRDVSHAVGGKKLKGADKVRQSAAARRDFSSWNLPPPCSQDWDLDI